MYCVLYSKPWANTLWLYYVPLSHLKSKKSQCIFSSYAMGTSALPDINAWNGPKASAFIEGRAQVPAL